MKTEIEVLTAERDEALAEVARLTRELENMTKERDAAKLIVKEDCENEVLVDRLCASVLGQSVVDGDSYGVPGMVECVRLTVEKLEKGREAARAELERVQKQAAQMREALETCQFTMSGGGYWHFDKALVRDALSTDAGKGYVPASEFECMELRAKSADAIANRLREDVKPLVEDVKAKEGSARVALAHFTKLKCDSQSVDCCVRCNVVALANWTLNAIAHAKAKGLT